MPSMSREPSAIQPSVSADVAAPDLVVPAAHATTLESLRLPKALSAAELEGFVTRPLGDRVRLLLLAVSGSHAYVTANPGSDVDYRGTFAQGRRNILSLEAPFDGINRSEPDDVQVDSLKRMLSLALAGKFSMAEMLFVPKHCVLHQDPLLDNIMAHRDDLVSRRWFKGILGYFNSQAVSLAAKGTGSNLGRMRAEYTRGPKDQPDEQYDGKFALHAIRLGYVGLDLAHQGRVIVQRPEAGFLLKVPDGEAFSTRSDLVSYLGNLDSQLKAACESSNLREEPDQQLWNHLYREVEDAA